MTPDLVPARARRGPAPPAETTSRRRRRHPRRQRPVSSGGQSGMLSLEMVLLLPLLVVLASLLLELAGLTRDVLVVHEAARAGARAAATSSGTAIPERAAGDAAPELDDLEVVVRPADRRDGDLVTVEVTTQRRIGPTTHQIHASTVARVEPGVGTDTRLGPPTEVGS